MLYLGKLFEAKEKKVSLWLEKTTVVKTTIVKESCKLAPILKTLATQFYFYFYKS